MIYLGNGMYSDPYGRSSLSHYGRKGMKWGQHIFGDDSDLRKQGIHLDTKSGNFKINNKILSSELHKYQMYKHFGDNNPKKYAPKLYKITEAQMNKRDSARNKYDSLYKKTYKKSSMTESRGIAAPDNNADKQLLKAWSDFCIEDDKFIMLKEMFNQA